MNLPYFRGFNETIAKCVQLVNRFSYFFVTIFLFMILVPGSLYAKHTSTSVGDYAGGLSASRHNLSSSGSFINTPATITIFSVMFVTGTTEMCVFCHTPHHTSTTAAPLWNKTSATTSFTTYGNGTENGLNDFDGKTYVGKTTVGDPKWGSLACLTCHDGVTTFDALINRPGKGTGTGDMGWVFRMKQGGITDLLTANKFDHFNTETGDGGCANSSCHGEPAQQLSNLVTSMIIGADLTNDHPISLRYRGGSVASLRESSTTISSINMCNQQEDLTCAEELVTGNLWAIAGFINSAATIADLLRGDTSGGGGPTVECSSCHDPHYKNLTNPEAGFYDSYNWDGGSVTDHTDGNIDGLFLRRVGGNSDSGVCRTCHAKADAI